jgi:glyoxylate/hydroxypyruvate reductase A
MAAQRLVICCPGFDVSSWVSLFAQALPGVDIAVWESGHVDARWAVVWKAPQDFWDANPQLEAAFNMGAGVDAMMQAQLPSATTVVRLTDVGMGVQMAEYSLHMVTRIARRFADYEAQWRDGGWADLKIDGPERWPIGVMGVGALGQRVLRSLQTLDYPLRGWSRTPRALEGVDGYHGMAQLPAFLAASRIVIVLLPLTPETHHLMNAERLRQLPQGAHLINLARGPLVDVDALLAALDEGHLAGAVLDVFEQEPLPADHALRRHPLVQGTPHISARTRLKPTVARIAQQVRALLDGARPDQLEGVVNRLRGY